MDDQTTFEKLLKQARKLPPYAKLRLIYELVTVLRYEWPSDPSQPRRSALGIVADLGPAPSAEDIDEVRKEVWKDFPREDI